MTKREIERIARQVAASMAVRLDGERDEPETWVRAAREAGCAVAFTSDPLAGRGAYTPVGAGEGAIAINSSQTPPAQARALAHEIAHHLLMPLVPGSLFGDPITLYYDDDPLDVRHRIARRAEELCFTRK